MDTSALPAGMNRRGLRYAIRALRGRVLRSELYALDGDPNADRPYQISDHAYALAPVLDGRQASDPGWQATPVVAVQPVLDRASVWERGDDPMTTATVTGGYDDYGRPHQTVQIAVPRGRDPHITSPAGTSPYLATTTLTEYATRDDDTHYLINRVSLQQRLELTEDTTTAGAALITYARQQLATPPTPTRRQHQSPDPHLLRRPSVRRPAHRPARRLGATHPGRKPGPHPRHPRRRLPRRRPIDPAAPLPAAWRHRLDRRLPAGVPGPHRATRRLPVPARPSPLPRRLVHASRNASPTTSSSTAAAADWSRRGATRSATTPPSPTTAYQLLPATVTDPVGLTRSATYDYRVLRPSLVTDPNGNQAAVGYTPLGLPAWIASTGKPGASQGDTPAQPGTVFAYDLTAWDDNPGNRQPMSVHTTRRVDHAWTLINAEAQQLGRPLTPPEIAVLFPPDETTQYPDRFIQKTEFTDGFGRMLQTRSQGDDTVLDDLGLTADMTAKPGPVVTHQQDPAAPPRSWSAAGRPTTTRAGSWRSTSRSSAPAGPTSPPPPPSSPACSPKWSPSTTHAGLAIRTVFPDGSEQRLIPGIPPDLTDPGQYTPTAWETYRYDNNDNAGRTSPAISAAWSSHWNTPSSDLLDPLGRVIEHTERTAATALTVRNTYDIDGNLLHVSDPLDRTASLQVYDLQGRSWRQQLIDAGTTRVVLDAAGNTIEPATAKEPCGWPPPTPCAARCGHGPATARSAPPPSGEAFVYGDDQAETGLQPADAAAANLLGRPYHTYDEAGRAETTSYDLDGNLLEKTRRVLSTSVLMSAVPGPAGDWADAFYQADWQPSPGQTLAQHADPLLDPTDYTISTSYDALARPTSVTVTAPARR